MCCVEKGYLSPTKKVKRGIYALTEGKVLKKITVFAMPCILSRVLQNLYTLVDTLIVGQAMDSSALASVGSAGSLISLFTDTVIGLMMGFSVVAGKRFGAGKRDELKKVFANSLILAFGASVLITVFATLFAENMLSLLAVPSALMDNAVLYVRIIFIGISTSVFYNFLCEMLRAVGNSKQPLYFLIFSSVIHIAMILLFDFVLDLGVVGAGLSTVLSQACAVWLCFGYIKKNVPDFVISKSDLVPDRAVLAECLHIGIPMAVTNFVVSFGVIILSFITNKIGTEYVTAYSCASRIGYIVTTPIFGFAAALSVFASQNAGAGRLDRVREGVRKTCLLVTAINGLLALFMFFATRPMLTAVINDSETAVDAGVMYLAIRCTAMFVLTFAAIYKNVLIGLGKPRFPTVSGFIEIAVRYAFPIAFASRVGFASVPLTDGVAWLVLAAFLAPAYYYELHRMGRQA